MGAGLLILSYFPTALDFLSGPEVQSIVSLRQVHCWKPGFHIVALGHCHTLGLLTKTHVGPKDLVSEATGSIVHLPFPGFSGKQKRFLLPQTCWLSCLEVLQVLWGTEGW